MNQCPILYVAKIAKAVSPSPFEEVKSHPYLMTENPSTVNSQQLTTSKVFI
ncbi:hypothetical protein GXM_01335 [Nostoc sphaeroides CCNUC1]|uniref:Uncharacterized protein n=1 Tax=Nostoc sphaeroides CCNUC1 TaxID=2653204 RepID=A0A5P8VTZ5_9NOSO|nr:hypothetical protein GXM_01335 [Nostoc sphaeroides CCNUC1]